MAQVRTARADLPDVAVMTLSSRVQNPLGRQVVLVWAVVLFVLVSARGESVDLRPKFEVGQTSRFEIWTRRNTLTTLSMGGQSRRRTRAMLVEGEVTWAVDEVHDDGSATCSMTLDWVTVILTLPDGSEQSNDSRQDNGDTPPLHDLLRAMAGAPIKVEVARNGGVNSVEGVDAIHDQLEDSSGAPGEIDFKETASDLAILAAAPVEAEPGKSWKDEFSWQRDLGMLRHQMVYTLDSVEEIAGIQIATISGEAELSFKPDLLPQDGPPIDVRLADGSTSTQIMFDLHRGEAAGRINIEKTTMVMEHQIHDVTVSTTIAQTVQNQVIRIAEN